MPTPPATLRGRRTVVGVALLLVLAQTAWRAWAWASSWWYADDLELLEEARRGGLSVAELLRPQDSHLMPLGRLLAWTAAQAGDLAWWPGAVQLVVLQLATGLAAVWMLVRLFGARPAVLAPLALYLCSVPVLAGSLWWASAVNQLPLHLAFFLAVGCHTTYARTGRTRWALLAALAVVLGATAYEKAVLLLPVLLVLSLGALTTGGPRQRLALLLTQWRAWALYAVVGAAYTAAYAWAVPSPGVTTGQGDRAGLFRTLVAESWASATLGGPWRWSDPNPPLQLADPPTVAVVLSWVVVLLAVVVALVRRRSARTAPLTALTLVVSWLASAYVLLAVGRLPQFGDVVGLELRYLADTAMVTTLAVALASLPLVDPDGHHDPDDPDARTPTTPARPARADGRVPLVAVAVVAVVVLGSVVSGVRYVGAWHEPYPVRAFVAGARDAAEERPRTVADVPVPEDVLSPLLFPSNLPSRLLGALGGIEAVGAGTDLGVLGSDGTVGPATVRAFATSPPGPTPECGYRVGSAPTPVPVAGEGGYFWWASVSYLAADDATVTLRLGAAERRVQVVRGLHTLFVRGEGGYGPVSLTGSDDVPVCVDAVRVGDLVTIEEAR